MVDRAWNAASLRVQIHITPAYGRAHQSVVRVDAAVGGALRGAVGGVPSSQHAAVVALLAHAAAAAAPGVSAVVAV